MTSDPQTELDELIAAYLVAAEKGRAPEPAEWLARNPDHAAELAAFLENLDSFGGFLGLPASRTIEATIPWNDGNHPHSVDNTRLQGEPFGGYQLLNEIGQGGMGTVHRARLNGTTLLVALKQVRTDAMSPMAVQRFREEVEAAASLRHPNIVPVYHVGEENGRPYFTMALIEGGSLENSLSRYHDQFQAIAQLMIKIARAVHYAHMRQLLHRDLKPANILLDEAGEPHVADFGLAARLNDMGVVTSTGPASGSLPWMAPETLDGERTLTTAVDVWSLGVILYQLLTAVRPFPGRNWHEVHASILNATPALPRTLNPRVPRDLEAICRRCLARDPEQRYESASAVANELERWLRDEPIRARPAASSERFSRWFRRNPGIAIGSLIAMALLITGFILSLALFRDQEKITRQVVCQDNAYAAQLAAWSLLRRLEQHETFVRETAEDPEFLKACASDDPKTMAHTLTYLRQKIETPPPPGTVGIASLFVLNEKGTILAITPEVKRVAGFDLHERDYFQGALARVNRVGRERVHLSRVFSSRNDHLQKLAISIPFQPTPGGPVWVLAATIPPNPTLGLHVKPKDRHLVALLAPGEDMGYVILVHPAYEANREVVAYPEDDLARLRAPDGQLLITQDENYRDPVQLREHEAQDRWLAGFAPVEGTDLIVVVQQRYEEAIAPLKLLSRRLLNLLIGLVVAGTIGLVIFLFLKNRQAAGNDPIPKNKNGN